MAEDLAGHERVMLAYVEKLTLDPAGVSVHDVEELRQAGFDDRAIHDVAAVTAYFAFVNRVALGLGVEIEDYWEQPSEEREVEPMKPKMGRAIAGGVVGTALISMMMYWVAPLMMGMPMDVAAMLSGMLGTSWGAGMAIHWMLGSLLFPIAYAVVVYGLLPGAPWLRGALFGLILWLLAEVVVTPLAGGGVFHGGNVMAVMGGFMGHLVYGLALGAIAGGGTAAQP